MGRDQDDASPEAEFSGGTSSTLPPQDLDAERATLGGIMLKGDILDEVPFLKGTHFYSAANAAVFEAARHVWQEQSTPVDAITVAQELEKRGQLGVVGGPAYIASLLEAVPHAAHTAFYAKLVFDRWQRREIGYIGLEALREAKNLSDEPVAVAAKFEGKLHSLLESDAGHAVETVDSIMFGLWKHLDEGGITGEPTGYESLDAKIDLKPGNVVILAARPSQGKSALGANIAVRFAKRGIGCHFVSLEMTKIELAERLLASEANVPIHLLRNFGAANESQRSSVLEASSTLSALPILIDAPPDATISNICSQARITKRRHNIGLLVVDYLQLVSPDDRRQPREQQVATISRLLKQLAKSLEIPIICLAQLNREVEKRKVKRPQLADLRESGAIEQDADIVLMLWRPSFYEMTGESADQLGGEQPTGWNDPTYAEVVVAKNRGGTVGIAKLSWDGETTTFRDPSVMVGGAF